MDNVQGEQQIARITVVAKLEFLPAVMSFVRETSLKLGLDAREAEHLELVAEEACLNVIEHAFDPQEPGTYDVIILRSPGQVTIAVEDKGLPFDFRKHEAEHDSSLGMILMKAFADEVHFLNLGREGKRVEIIKRLPYQDISSYVSAEDKVLSPTEPALPTDIPITIKATEPSDSVSLARLIYRCYGYTYPNDYIYYPDRVSELLASGQLLSYIALNPEGEVIGHIAVKRNSADAVVGDGGQAVVDPRYRGNGFLGKLILSFYTYCQGKGMLGAYSEAVTVHPYSQKAGLAMGAYETGVLLGFVPNMTFKKIGGEEWQRQSVVLLYTSAGMEPARNVYLPLHHEAIIRDIYGKGTLKRNIISVTDYKEHVVPATPSEVDVKVIADFSQAYMQISRFGNDLAELVKFRLNEICLRRIECIYLDMPLSNPATQKWVPALEMLGFFFGGIIPELADGDVLRLQYLNNLDVRSENIQTASDFGKRLVEYVHKAMERS